MHRVSSAARRRRRSTGGALVLVSGGAAGALAGVAVSEWALTWLPPRVHAPGIYRAFDDGWAFGIALATFGLAALGAAWRSGRRVA
jgi:hypothetical protein